VEKNSTGASTLKKRQEVIELNLAQCGNAYENLYFASLARVQATLEAFRKRSDAVRPPRPALKETQFRSEDRRGVMLTLPRQARHLSMPKVVKIRYAAKTGKYKRGRPGAGSDARSNRKYRARPYRQTAGRGHEKGGGKNI
jgi:hypothetical protein